MIELCVMCTIVIDLLFYTMNILILIILPIVLINIGYAWLCQNYQVWTFAYR